MLPLPSGKPRLNCGGYFREKAPALLAEPLLLPSLPINPCLQPL